MSLLSLLMFVDSPSALKRRRLTTIDPMDSESAKAVLAAAKQKYGRDIRVFETPLASQTKNEASNSDEPPDDFYDFTPEDYYRVAPKNKDKVLKIRKYREAEEAARRPKMTKAVIRVRFPDNITLEATFHPSETIQSLVDLLMKMLARPELPFYIYTTPPRKQLKDMSLDLYSAGFAPGAVVYFSLDLPKGDDGAATSGPFLSEEVMALKDLELIAEEEKPEPIQAAPEPVPENPSPAVVQERKPATDKKTVKPKWLKM